VIQLLPHFLFGAWCQRGSETFIYLSVWNFGLLWIWNNGL
jgi:hypothetical protein